MQCSFYCVLHFNYKKNHTLIKDMEKKTILCDFFDLVALILPNIPYEDVQKIIIDLIGEILLLRNFKFDLKEINQANINAIVSLSAKLTVYIYNGLIYAMETRLGINKTDRKNIEEYINSMHNNAFISLINLLNAENCNIYIYQLKNISEKVCWELNLNLIYAINTVCNNLNHFKDEAIYTYIIFMNHSIKIMRKYILKNESHDYRNEIIKTIKTPIWKKEMSPYILSDINQTLKKFKTKHYEVRESIMNIPDYFISINALEEVFLRIENTLLDCNWMFLDVPNKDEKFDKILDEIEKYLDIPFSSYNICVNIPINKIIGAIEKLSTVHIEMLKGKIMTMKEFCGNLLWWLNAEEEINK